MGRTFVVVGHDAATGPDFHVQDLPGSAGRLDVLVRCVTSALLVSHGIREDVTVYLVLQGPPDPPKTVRLDGARLRGLNPDERSTALLVQKALDLHMAGPVWRESTPGVAVSERGLEDLEDELEGALVILEEGAPDAAEAGFPEDPVLFLSDHQDWRDEERALLEAWGAEARGLGETPYHADQAVTVASWLLDRRDG